MKYQIEINGIVSVECGTRDLAIFIGGQLKKGNPTNEIVVLKDGEVLMYVR